MKLRVTAQDVRQADQVAKAQHPECRQDPGARCPTAQALFGRGYAEVYVGTTVTNVRLGEWRGRFRLPPALQAEIESWDHGFGFRPIEVELTPVKT